MTDRRLLNIILAIVFFPGLLPAQQNEFQWRFGIYNGISHLHGDLSYKFFDPNSRSNEILKNPEYFTNAVALERRISNGLGIGLMYTQGQFIANDRSIDRKGNLRTDNPDFLRSLNANTKIKDLSLLFTFHLDNGKILGNRAFVAPYFKLGAGFMVFNVFGDLFYGENGDQRYYYWDDYTVRDLPPGTDGAEIIEQDGAFETKLNGLKTEGTDYNNKALSITGGVGLKFRLGSRFNLNLEMLARLGTTDYLDDVSGAFPTEYESDLQRYAANPADIDRTFRGEDNDRNDFYTYTSISLHYNFGRKKRAYSVPAIAVGPLMASPPPQKKTPVADSLRQVVDTSLLATNDSLQYLVDSLRSRIAQLTMPVDSLLADSLRRVADSLYMRADSLYPLQRVDSSRVDTLYLADDDSLEYATDSIALVAIDSVQGAADTVNMVTQDSAAQRQIEELEQQMRVMSDSLLVARTQLAAAQAYEPLPDTIPPQEKVVIYQEEMDEMRQDVEQQRSAGDLTPEEQTRIAALEDQFDQYDRTLRRMERAINNADEYKQLEKEIERLRKQLNITTGVGAAAGITAAVAGSSGNKKDKKAEEAAQAERQAMQAQIDSLNRVVTQLTQQDTMPVDSLDMPADTIFSQPNIIMTTNEDSLQMIIQRQEQAGIRLQAQLDSLQRELETARNRPGLQSRQSVYFAVNSSTLDPPARQTVKNIAQILLQYPELKVHLEGYTDPSGSIAYNRQLSERRSQAVKEYLLELSVPEDRVVSDPQGVDQNSENPELGRRVELILKGG